MKLIIFDMDGTLVDTGMVIANTINHVRNHIGLQSLGTKIVLEKLNDPHTHSPRFFYNCEEYTPMQIKLFEEYYTQNCTNGIALYEGIESLLQKLHGNYQLSIATNAHQKFAKQILDHLNIEKYFQHIVGADMVQIPKPHPQMIHYTMEKHNVQNHNCIVVGDSLKDSMAAQKAGARSITVNWGFTQHKDENVVHQVSHLEQLLLNF